ncbi:hypothetical protein SPLC1_S208280 [Arthrospira platensis C1]|nr:hypothetical protein SPLC1_S208280 [Arthrospira platensis C1]
MRSHLQKNFALTNPAAVVNRTLSLSGRVRSFPAAKANNWSISGTYY